MKKNTLKNIFVSICIVFFVATLFYVAITLIYDSIFENAICNDISNFIEQQNIGNDIRDDIKSFNEENGIEEYEKKIVSIHYASKEIVLIEFIYVIVFSIIIGIVIGYLKTVIKASQDKTTLVKKVVLTYLIFCMITVAFFEIVNLINYNTLVFDTELVIVIIISMICYLAVSLALVAMNNHNKNKLNILMKESKEANK